MFDYNEIFADITGPLLVDEINRLGFGVRTKDYRHLRVTDGITGRLDLSIDVGALSYVVSAQGERADNLKGLDDLLRQSGFERG